MNDFRNGVVQSLGFLVITALWARLLKYNRDSELASIECENLREELVKWKELRTVERKGRISAQQKAREIHSQDSEDNGYRYKSIGVVESPFPDRRGTPRQPQLVTAGRGKIRFNKKAVQLDFFKELEQFSHIWVIFVFHVNTNVGSGKVLAKIKPPRLNGQKVGCLSTRSPHRPNNIGLSVCQVGAIGKDYIEVIGIDMVNGTPVLDSKYFM